MKLYMSKKQKNRVAAYGLMFLWAVLLLSGRAAHGYDLNTIMLSHAAKSSAGGAVQGEGVKLSYSLAAEHLALHEPVILNFTAQNNSGQGLILDLGADNKTNFLFNIKSPDGKMHQLRRARRDGISLIGKIALEAGQEFTQKLLLNEWFEFAEPGVYEISARLVMAQSNGDEPADASESPDFSAHLVITERDEERLNQTCSALLKQITSSSSYAEAAEAALALSYVNDGAAIPFLDKALSSGKMVETIAIAGLERIDGKEAERVLAAAAEASQNEDVKIQVEAAVERLRARKGIKPKPAP